MTLVRSLVCSRPHSCVTDLVGGDRALIGERSPGQQ
jgi:hypothetical protein